MRDESGRVEQSNRELQLQLNDTRNRLAESERTIRELNNNKRSENGSTDRVRTLESQLEEAKEDGNKRVSETSQFQQMKKLMQTQSSKIRDLKRRLERYEPDNTKEEDD